MSHSFRARPFLVLKVDADTYRGTREGVPRLVTLLNRYQARATFLFTLGPDHTGWALKQIFRPGFFRKVSRTSVVEHYGLKTLMYGVLLPAPDIGKKCADVMRSAAAAGFECGIHTWDHRVWQDTVHTASDVWTRTTLTRCTARFETIFGKPATTFGAAGWQMNPSAFRYVAQYGMRYASDSRTRLNDDGSMVNFADGPYRIGLDHKEGMLSCVQMPTTLPTLDELLGRTVDGVVLNAQNVADHILGLTAKTRDHVFTLHTELEGNKLAPVFEALLAGWKKQGYFLASMKDYYLKIQHDALPESPLDWGTVPGRSGDLVLQGPAV